MPIYFSNVSDFAPHARVRIDCVHTRGEKEREREKEHYIVPSTSSNLHVIHLWSRFSYAQPIKNPSINNLDFSECGSAGKVRLRWDTAQAPDVRHFYHSYWQCVLSLSLSLRFAVCVKERKKREEKRNRSETCTHKMNRRWCLTISAKKKM